MLHVEKIVCVESWDKHEEVGKMRIRKEEKEMRSSVGREKKNIKTNYQSLALNRGTSLRGRRP